MQIFDMILNRPLGWLLEMIYGFVNNYGLAIIIFTVLTKIVLMPLNLKQQKSAAQMQKIKPLLDEVQKKYANNREKMSEETMKLYKEYNINPAGGCLPLLIQFPIIFALYKVIREPLTFILGYSAEKVTELAASVGIVEAANTYTYQIDVANKAGLIDFSFLWGLFDLSQTPNISQPSLIWIIPIIAAAATFLQSKLMYIGLSKEEVALRKPKKKEKEASNPNGRPPRPGEKQSSGMDPTAMTNGMTYMMPIMTLMFTFTMPAGISVYWIAGSLIQIGITYVTNKYIIPRMKVEAKKDEVQEVRDQLRNKRKNGR